MFPPGHCLCIHSELHAHCMCMNTERIAYCVHTHIRMYVCVEYMCPTTYVHSNFRGMKL